MDADTTFVVDSVGNVTRLHLSFLEAALDEVYTRRAGGQLTSLVAVLQRAGEEPKVVPLMGIDDAYPPPENLRALVEAQEDL